MSRILLVEDDKDLSTIIADHLRAERYAVEHAPDGLSAWEHLSLTTYDLIILDWDVPGKSGIDICVGFRSQGGNTPIIMLTGKRKIEDKETGLDSGADDYLTKPFSLRELSARVRALLRRPEEVASSNLRVRDIEMDLVKHSVTRAGTAIHLQPQDFALLEFLMKHQNQVFSPEALLARVWGSDTECTAESLRSAIKRLRQKLDPPEASNSIIENVPRVGYRISSN